jgi:hypothetical protein
MQKSISPALKGIITAALMIAYALWFDRFKNQVDERLQYFIYLIYAAGIAWALWPSRGNSFAALFGIGFRCFIVVTLVMATFTFVFIKTHPGLTEQEAINTREYYMKQKDITAPQIEDIVRRVKKQYPLMRVSLSILGYLITGAVANALLSVAMSRRKN